MNPPSLHTPRLHLRPCERDDIDSLHAFLTDPDIRRYLCDGVVVPRETAARFVEESLAGFARQGLGLWLVCPPGEEPVGFCGFLLAREAPELIYGLAPACWGRGLATEAARAVLRHAFDECQLERIIAGTDTPNVGSLGVLERLGMRPTHREPGAFGEVIWFELRCELFAP